MPPIVDTVGPSLHRYTCSTIVDAKLSLLAGCDKKEGEIKKSLKPDSHYPSRNLINSTTVDLLVILVIYSFQTYLS